MSVPELALLLGVCTCAQTHCSRGPAGLAGRLPQAAWCARHAARRLQWLYGLALGGTFVRCTSRVAGSTVWMAKVWKYLRDMVQSSVVSRVHLSGCI